MAPPIRIHPNKVNAGEGQWFYAALTISNLEGAGPGPGGPGGDGGGNGSIGATNKSPASKYWSSRCASAYVGKWKSRRCTSGVASTAACTAADDNVGTIAIRAFRNVLKTTSTSLLK